MMAKTLTIRQRDSLRTGYSTPALPKRHLLNASAGQPLEIYQARAPWSMWAPVITLVCILCAALLAVVYMAMTGSITLAEIDLATKQAEQQLLIFGIAA